MSFFRNLLIFTFCAAPLLGQHLSGINHSPTFNTFSSDTLRILAVMAEFQSDNDATTAGTGKFGSNYSKDYGQTILDPLPHDSTYFSNHLLFAKNYFKRVSSGKLVIEFTVLPKVLTLNKKIRDYSPAIRSTDFTGLAQMTDEVWKKADSAFAGFQFSSYQVFTVFHAGVGRDISVPGSLGNERDLPSVYLNATSLKKYLGSSYEGVPVSGGTFKITNSIILPETESREVESFGTKYLFQISINGLLVASIGSHLGLPDLFDTKTGLSAIGKFGLMDGQSIFAYNGLFPPEPSAWEKYYLGWATLKTVAPMGGFYSAVNRVRQTGLQEIIKVPLSATEYYLVENRIRDVEADGVTITYIQNGTIKTKTFAKDTTGFYPYAIDSVQGVVIDVSDYDWALPGSGLVIWHIDEQVIAEKFTSNTINADSKRRGVDVEEADGIQDIGVQFTTVFGDVLVGEGAPEDFWYQLNPAKLYKNKFGVNTRPNTTANNGSNSLWEFSDFSQLNDSMSFSLTRSGKYLTPEWKNNSLGKTVQVLSLNGISIDFAQANDVQFVTAMQGKTLNIISKAGVEKSYQEFSSTPVAITTVNNSGIVCGLMDTVVNIAFINNGSISRLSVNSPIKISSPPVIKNGSAGNPLLYFGTENGSLYSVQLNINNPPFPVLSLVEQNSQDGALRRILVAGDSVIKIFSGAGTTVLVQPGVGTVKVSKNFRDAVVSRDADGNLTTVILWEDQSFSVYKNGQLYSTFSALGSSVTSFSLCADKRYKDFSIVYTSGASLYSVNIAGVINSGFPVKSSTGQAFVSSLLAFDYTNDGKEELFALTKDGTLCIYDGFTGDMPEGTALYLGTSFSGNASIITGTVKKLVTVDSTNEVSLWTLVNSTSSTGWSSLYGNAQQTGYAGRAAYTVTSGAFFEKSKVYNYPNPAYEGFTNIRYQVLEDATITITIYDLAGDKVAQLTGFARGGVEQETTWRLNGVESGVYLAKIVATSSSGKQDEAIIKIAVVN